MRYNQNKNINTHSEPFLALISKLYLLCQLFATAPILDTPKNNRRILRYVRYVWCSTLVTYITVVNISYMSRIHDPLVNIVKAFFAFELINNPLIVAFIVFTTYYYTAEYRSIPSELLRIYKVYQRLQANISAEKEFFRVLHMEVLVMAGVICSIILSTFVVDYFRSERTLMRAILHASVFSVANILISLHICQFWLSLRFISHLYRGFNEVLRQRLRRFRVIDLTALDECNNDLHAYGREISWYQREFQNTCNAMATDSFEILDMMRDIYFDLDTISTQLTNVFGITLLFNFLGSCVSLSVQFFAVFKFFDTENFLNDVQAELYNRILWIIIHLGRIMTVLISNNAIIEEKCRTSCVLNELQVSSKEMERSINRFLLRLMTHQPPEMLCGILQLDLLVLCGITGAVSNYFIFLAQIDLGTLPIQQKTTNSTA
ncbi:putative gustatory receptor 59e [Ceratitis capitata]|uniref:putative gustatory receptor 59e n=1 Tax=Ceratitis capitata TaxID=7213 RepID=UPI000A11879D|nr:putative gustatory receptor 59e [Ceratitis capitata]